MGDADPSGTRRRATWGHVPRCCDSTNLRVGRVGHEREPTVVDLPSSADAHAPAGSRSLRVFAAGGRRLAREGLMALLSADPCLEVVGSAGELLATRAAIQRLDVDVLVTHVWLERPSGGAELTIALREERPEVGVVLLIGDGDVSEVRGVLDQGTAQRALLLMDHPRCTRDLTGAVHEVAEGGSVVHPGVVDLILRAERVLPGHLDGLTQREQDVLAAIARGASNRAVAEQLHLSDRAVEKHINALYTKLGLPTDGQTHRRVAAALLAHGCLGRDANPRPEVG